MITDPTATSARIVFRCPCRSPMRPKITTLAAIPAAKNATNSLVGPSATPRWSMRNSGKNSTSEP